MNSRLFKQILHPTDFTAGDDNALAHALRIGLANEADVTLLHISEEGEQIDWRDFPSIRERLKAWQFLPENASREQVEATGIRLKKALRRGRHPAPAIAAYFDEHPCDLLVLATHQRSGWTRAWKGSISEALARKSATMTLFVPRNVRGFVSPSTGCVRLRNILVPISASPNPTLATRAAAALGGIFSCAELRMTLLHVGREADAPSAPLAEHTGWTIERTCWEGDVVPNILETASAQESDLIVMTTAGHHGVLDALRGSTTEQVLEHATCPVLAVPSEFD